MKYLIIVVALFCTMTLQAQIEFFVSPAGNDANLGTQTEPFRSLVAARNAIRDHKNKNSKLASYTVFVGDGFYSMQEPLVLTFVDSGTEEYPIVYQSEKGAKPVFSGGKKIEGFRVTEQGIWEATLSECRTYNLRFDQLYVNDTRATLARSPNQGFYKIKNIEEEVWKKDPKARVAERAQQTITFESSDFEFLQSINEEAIDLLRFRAYHKWDFTIRHIDKLSMEQNSLTTSGRGMKPWNPMKQGGRVVLENYQAALDSVGEWFLTPKGVLQYIPLPGQTIENTEIVAPILNTLVEIVGNASDNEMVENIRFEGLAFKHCHYRIPSTGFEPNQAAVRINAAVELEGAKNIRFSNCEISHTGQHALWFGKGCSYSEVRNCYLNNLGGGGVYLGSTASLEGEEHTHHIVLENNIIQSGGKEFPPAVGVWVGHSSDIQVTHNDIGNFYYTGVSVGWTWGYTPSSAKRNIISYNHIHHIGWDLLSDMSGIYTLGKSEGTVISNNQVDHIHSFSYGGWGLYTDEGSSDILLENNLVYSTKTGGFHQHYGKDNVVKNNIFAFAKKYQVQATRIEKHRSFDFANNIVVFDEGVVLSGAWKDMDLFMDQNLYWNTSGNEYSFVTNSFTDWQATGKDKNSIIANPNFKDATNFDFTLKNKSAIRKIDFQPFDFSEIGVYGSKYWKEKSQLPAEILSAFDKAVKRNMQHP